MASDKQNVGAWYNRSMDPNAFDDFQKINFDRPWSEEDWERFFQAQDRLTANRRRRTRTVPRETGGVSELAFRNVLHRFGMDPDNPDAEPRPFSLTESLDDVGSNRFPFWRDGADHERLPLYLRSREFVRAVDDLVDRRFAAQMAKTYKNPSHRLFQKTLRELDLNSRAIPRLIALGHRVGYDPFGVVGNIVRCRKALERAELCVSTLSRLPRRHLDPSLFKSLFTNAVRLRNDLSGWILMLRTRFASQ